MIYRLYGDFRTFDIKSNYHKRRHVKMSKETASQIKNAIISKTIQFSSNTDDGYKQNKIFKKKQRT